MDVFDLSAKISLDTSKYDSGLKASESKMSSFALSLKSGLGKAAKVGGAAIGVIGVATTALTKKFVDGAKSTAKYGDKVDKMSQKIGISAESYQKWDYVMQRAGTSVDTLKMGMKTLSSQATKNAEEFKKLGISQDELKSLSKEDLFGETIESLSKMKDGTERTTIATKLLGRTGADIGPLLNQGSDAIKEQMKIAEDYGMVMSDKAVKASADFEDSMTTLSMTATGLKNRLMGEFLPSITKVTDGLALLFTGDMSGLDKIEKGIDKIISKVSNVMPKILEIGGSIIAKVGESLLENLPQLVETTTSILGSLGQGILEKLPDFLEIGGQILTTLLKGITDAIPSIMDTLSELLPQFIETITSLIVSLADALPEIIVSITEKLPELISKIVEAVKKALPELIQAGITLFMGLIEAIQQVLPPLIEALPQIIDSILAVLNDNMDLILEGGLKMLMALIDAIPKVIGPLTDALPKIIDSIVQFLIDNIDKILDAAIKLFLACAEAIPKVLPQVLKGIGKLIVSIAQGIWKLRGKVLDSGKKLFAQIGEAIPKVWNKIKDAIADLGGKIVDAFKALPGKLAEIGKNLIEGLWNGIKNMASWIKEKITGFGEGVLNSLKDFFGIKSPSKVFAEVGKFLALGLGEGWDETIPSVMKDISNGMDFSAHTFTVSQKPNDTRKTRESLKEMTEAIVEAINESNNTTIELNSREIGRVVRNYV